MAKTKQVGRRSLGTGPREVVTKAACANVGTDSLFDLILNHLTRNIYFWGFSAFFSPDDENSSKRAKVRHVKPSTTGEFLLAFLLAIRLPRIFIPPLHLPEPDIDDDDEDEEPTLEEENEFGEFIAKANASLTALAKANASLIALSKIGMGSLAAGIK